MSYTTRSGRQIKKPDRYEPKEICEDDCEEDIDEEDIFSTDESESESESDEEDADENGNLKGFVVSDSDEEDVA